MKVNCIFLDNGQENVFGIEMVLLKDDMEIGRAELLFPLTEYDEPFTHKTYSFQISTYKDFDRVVFVFQENKTPRYISATKKDLKMCDLGYYGIVFYLETDPLDSPTYVGDYEYYHPLVKVLTIPSSKITPRHWYEL